MNQLYNKVLQEKIYYQQLDNGLSIYLLPKENYNRQYGVFATRYGSIDSNFVNPLTGREEKVPEGIAHFLEHKLFEGKVEDTFASFAKIGVSVNAYTNYDTTAYLFSSTGNFTEAVLNLINFVQAPYFTEENVEKEKGIIAQEIKMYQDDPGYQAYYNLLRGLYQKHPVRIDIAGTVESIYQITKEDLYLCYNTFYHPGNMILFLIGNFEPDRIFEFVLKNQSEKKYKDWQDIKRVFPEEPAMVNKRHLKKRMDVAQPILRIGYKEKYLPTDSVEGIKRELATDILLETLVGKSTELYQELYEEGLVDDNFHHYFVLENGYGYAMLGGDTEKPGVLEERLIGGIAEGIKSINKESYERIHKKYLGEYVQNFNSFEMTANEFINYYFKGVSYFDVLDILNDINLEYLLHRYEEFFDVNQLVTSIIQNSDE